MFFFYELIIHVVLPLHGAVTCDIARCVTVNHREKYLEGDFIRKLNCLNMHAYGTLTTDRTSLKFLSHS